MMIFYGIKIIVFLEQTESGFLRKLCLLDDIFQSEAGLPLNELKFRAKKKWVKDDGINVSFGDDLFQQSSGAELGPMVFDFGNGYVTFNIDNLKSIVISISPPNRALDWNNVENYNWKQSLLPMLNRHIKNSSISLYTDGESVTGSMVNKYLYLKRNRLYGSDCVIENQGKKKVKRNIALFAPFLEKKIDSFSEIDTSSTSMDLRKYDVLIKNNICKKDLCYQLKKLYLSPYRWLKLICLNNW